MMNKTLKQTLLASVVMMGVANLAMAQTNTKAGFYAGPNVEVIFVGKEFTKNQSRTGGGIGAVFGYQFNGLSGNRANNLQIELATNYQYYSSTRTTMQNITRRGEIVFSETTDGIVTEPSLVNTTATTSVGGREHFIPITIGVRLNYMIPFSKSRSFFISPGIASGLWIHTIDKTSTRVIDFGAYNDRFELVPLITTTTTDEASETRAVIVPSLAFGYSPSRRVTFSLAGKVYIVPSGYSDNYSTGARAAATDVLFAPTYNEIDKDFWYGSLNFGLRYRF